MCNTTVASICIGNYSSDKLYCTKIQNRLKKKKEISSSKDKPLSIYKFMHINQSKICIEIRFPPSILWMLLSFLGSFLGVVDDHLASDVKGCGSAVAGNAALWQAGLPAGSRGRFGIPLQSITSSFDHGGLVVDNQWGKRFPVVKNIR